MGKNLLDTKRIVIIHRHRNSRTTQMYLQCTAICMQCVYRQRLKLVHLQSGRGQKGRGSKRLSAIPSIPSCSPRLLPFCDPRPPTGLEYGRLRYAIPGIDFLRIPHGLSVVRMCERACEMNRSWDRPNRASDRKSVTTACVVSE